MRALAFVIALGFSQMDWSADELALFKESVTQILVGKYLGRTEYGAYVCVKIDGEAPSEAQITSFQSLGIRDVGPPSECECRESKVHDDECFRKNSKQRACFLSVDDFQFRAFTNASASVGQSCGETNGDGEVARFEKHDGVWLYAGSVKRIVE
jgi:hypothetical protein